MIFTRLTVYQCKEKKSVAMLSSKHEKAEIAPEKGTNPNRQKKKLNKITSYNSRKCGVDTVDMMAKQYSVKYATRRWPVQVWSNILKLAAINACSI